MGSVDERVSVSVILSVAKDPATDSTVREILYFVQDDEPAFTMTPWSGSELKIAN